MLTFKLYPNCNGKCEKCDFGFLELDDMQYSCEYGDLHRLGYYNKYEEKYYLQYGEEALTIKFREKNII